MATGEMLVGTEPTGYAIRSRNGGSNYTTKDGGFATEAEAQTAGKALAAIVGPEFDIVPNIRVVVQGRRGRKPKVEGNGQTIEVAAQSTDTATSNTEAPVEAASETPIRGRRNAPAAS